MLNPRASKIRCGRFSNERGTSLVEYALLVALIAAICVISIKQFGERREEQWNKVGDAFEEALG
jgi:Flp pilus assembly pilin Flp